METGTAIKQMLISSRIQCSIDSFFYSSNDILSLKKSNNYDTLVFNLIKHCFSINISLTLNETCCVCFQDNIAFTGIVTNRLHHPCSVLGIIYKQYRQGNTHLRTSGMYVMYIPKHRGYKCSLEKVQAQMKNPSSLLPASI